MAKKETGLCQDCRSYKGCGGHENYSYPEIRWCPYQVIWLIENADSLRTSGWDIDDDNLGSPNTKTQAGFVNIANVLAEVDIRVAAAGRHGQKLRDQILQEGRTFSNLSFQAMAALMYIKGWRRKRIPYARWLREIFLPSHRPKIQAVAKSENITEKQG